MEKSMTTGDPREAGFSMVELLVAMVITLMISGAIFGLLTGGNNAFRREPEMTDRQQSIRIAMDIIKRDIAGAGAGMVPFVQAFTNGLDGQGGAPSTTQTAGAIAGTATDILQVLTASGQCTSATLTAAPALDTDNWISAENLPSCFPDTTAPNSFFYIGSSAAAERAAYGIRMGKANVAATVAPFQIVPLAPAINVNPTAGGSAGFCDRISAAGIATSCTVVMPVDVVRYQVSADPDDPTLPALWRSRTGTFSSAGANVGGAAPGNGNWEVVARGIEDLQVEYFRNGGWNPTPGDVTCTAPCTTPVAADFLTVVRQVRVTLSARATGRGRIQGQRTGSGGAGNAIRGQLQAVMTPRAVLTTLTLNTSSPGWY
jgi:Tfp pilus assembly protein PilW